MVMQAIVLTLMGNDRPGLVVALSRCVANHGGNWEESRMAHLGGQFVGLLRVTVPADRREALEQALADLGHEGLRVHSQADVAERPSPPVGGRRLMLQVTAQDREGIVRDVSKVLADRAINVEELSTHCESAPMSGESMFKAVAILWLPNGDSGTGLREALEGIADDLIVDLQPAPRDEPS